MLTVRDVPSERADGVGAAPMPDQSPGAETLGPAMAQIARLGSPMFYSRNCEIFGEDEPASHVYLVLSGAVRTHKFFNDGRRQIDAFYLPGDIVGLELGERHQLSAEAICNATVSTVRRASLAALARGDGEVVRQMWGLTARELRRAQTRTLLLARTAQERVACFLLEMADRGVSDGCVDLPMSRQDIADYLGLTIETVSRTLTLLEAHGLIALPSARRIRLRNLAELRKLGS